MEIQSASYNRDENGQPISIRIVSDEGAIDTPLNGENWYNAALIEWLAADPVNNQISG